MNVLTSLSVNIHMLALTLGTVACGFVILGVWMTRRYFQQKTATDVDVERDYIANDQVSWTELLRILD